MRDKRTGNPARPPSVLVYLDHILIGAQCAAQIDRAELAGGDFLHALDQLWQTLVAHGKTSSRGMPAVVLHQLSALVQGVGDVKFRDTAAGCPRDLFALVGDDRRAVVALAQAGGCQPDNAGVKGWIGGKEQPAARRLGDGCEHKYLH